MRPSSMSLAASCPGSAKLNGYGSEQATQGSAFHELARAKILNEILDYDLAQKKYNLTDDAINDIRIGINNLDIKIPEGAIIHAEEFIQSPSMNLSGTPDFWLDMRPLGEPMAILIDWKNGRAEVSRPENNYQLLSYAVMLFENQSDIETINVIIMHTRLNQVSETTIDRARAMQLRDIIAGIIDRAENPEAEFVKGPWCGQCFNCLTCPAFAAQYIELANNIWPLPDTESKLHDVLRLMLPIAKRAATVAKGLEDVAKAWVDRNGSLDLGDGVRFCKVASTRKKLDTTRALPILREYFADEADSLIKLSSSAIYDLARAKGKGLNKEINMRLEQAGAFTSEDKIEYKIIKGVIEDGEGKAIESKT